VLRLVSTRLVPFGICAGSENQGGLHETGLAPVQAAVNHITTMTVDGQNRDLVNFWRHSDISAGDELIYRLAWRPTQHYTLNHYYKGTVRQSFVRACACWQLVPDVFSMSDASRPEAPGPWDYDYRVNGYWRVAQCFQHRGKYETDMLDIGNDMCFMRGQLLQVTFAPVWVQFQPLNHVDAPPLVRTPPAASLVPAEGGKRKRPLFEVLPKHAQTQALLFPPSSVLFRTAPRQNLLNWKTPHMQTAAALPGAAFALALPAAGLGLIAPAPQPAALVERPAAAPSAPDASAPDAASSTLAVLREQMLLLSADAEPMELAPSPRVRTPAPADDGKVRKVLNKGRRAIRVSDEAAL
jgi:hypothetical protein